MKKLLLMTMVLLAAAACSQDETTGPAAPGGPDAIEPPHFYGMATLDNETPQTRGVANKRKLWPSSMAAEDLTVKFLNGIPAYRKFVQEVAAEWEKAAGVRFFFVDDNQDALIRIGFDYVRGMRTSWSYTGIDNDELYDQQDQPTMHFAEWRRIGDAKRRSDVLRAFGQALGLELEYRHPMLDPGWIRNEDGTINEAGIREYWEYELAEFISWEELKKMVLDPINARNIASTSFYDNMSVMNWPFFEEIAHSQQPITTDADYKTELSEGDKSFIKELYGESFNGIPPLKMILPLIRFDYSELAPSFTLKTSKNLVVIWDNDALDACTHLELDDTGEQTFNVAHTYADKKKRTVVIAEVLDYGQEMPQSSTALKEFNFIKAEGAENFDIWNNNLALEKLSIRGGMKFISQAINLEARNCFKEIYLPETQSSTVTVDNCQNLETFATSPFYWKPKVSSRQIATLKPTAVNGFYEIDGPHIEVPGTPIYIGWPTLPMYDPSLVDVDIQNCQKLKNLILENTNLKTLKLEDHPDLEYIYLSSMSNFLVGGESGKLLVDALKDLPSRKGKSTGLIVIRGIGFSVREFGGTQFNPDEGQIIARLAKKYITVTISRANFNQLTLIQSTKNWQIVWDSGLQVSPN